MCYILRTFYIVPTVLPANSVPYGRKCVTLQEFPTSPQASLKMFPYEKRRINVFLLITDFPFVFLFIFNNRELQRQITSHGVTRVTVSHNPWKVYWQTNGKNLWPASDKIPSATTREMKTRHTGQETAVRTPNVALNGPHCRKHGNFHAVRMDVQKISIFVNNVTMDGLLKQQQCW